jgi:hypothetical protein
MLDAIGLGDVVDNATPPHPDMRDLTVGEAVQALGLNGLGVVTQARSLVPRCFPQQLTSRLMAPRMPPARRHEAAHGRAVERRQADGVTARYRRLAATAAKRLGRAATVAPRDRPRGHGDGRDTRADDPEAEVMPLGSLSRRERR